MQNLDELDQDHTMADWMPWQHTLTLRKFFVLWDIVYDDAYSKKVMFNVWKILANPLVSQAMILDKWGPRPPTDDASSS